MGQQNNKRAFSWAATGISIVIVLAIIFWSSECESNPTINSTTEIAYSSPFVPDTVTFCNEAVPMHYFDIHEALERELLVNSYYHSQTILFIKKANRYFPVIEPILKEYGIPDDFKYLSIAESGLANVVSPSNAVGFWQLLEGTAKDYGLEVNSEVDERYHLEKATIAACKYLKESYEKYGNWTMSAASYNVGRRGVNRQVERQKETDYYDLLFNEETARYVFRIIAFKLVIENPPLYNFNIPDNTLYKPISFKEVSIKTPIADWATFAKEHNTNYKMLKYLNPWLRDKQMANKSHKEYIIRVPKRNSREK